MTVILVAYYGDEWLPPCLESLANSSTHPLHLVLVDNAGNTVIDDLNLSNFDTEVIPTPRPMGFAEANNHALVKASHLEETVLFLNQDTISPSGWIDVCVEALNARPGLGAVSPLIRNYEDEEWDPSFMACLSDKQRAALEAESSSREVILTPNAPAPALMVRTSVLRKAGPFDPVFGSYYEDYDLCRRIREQGYQVGFCGTTSVRHFSGGSTKTDEEERHRMRQIIRNRVLYSLREHDESRLRGLLRWGLRDFPWRLARGIVGTPSSQPPSAILRALWDLFQIGGRLLSQRLDEQAWQQYLKEIGWKNRIEENTEHLH